MTAKELGVESQFMAPEILYGPELLEIASDAAEGLICVAPAKDFEDYEQDPTFSEFATRFQDRFGEKPDQYATNAYDGVKILAKAMADGGFEGYAVAEALRGIKTYEGVGSKMTFDGPEVIKPFAVYRVSAGKFIKSQDVTGGLR